MSEECQYSFGDLFQAAYHRELDRAEAMKFVLASQEEKNEFVRALARAANWGTRDRVGSDGKVYTAFSPTFNMNPTTNRNKI